jgi:hypothetical protein
MKQARFLQNAKKRGRNTVFYVQTKAVRLATPYILYEALKSISSGRVVCGSDGGERHRAAVLVGTEPGLV